MKWQKEKVDVLSMVSKWQAPPAESAEQERNTQEESVSETSVYVSRPPPRYEEQDVKLHPVSVALASELMWMAPPATSEGGRDEEGGSDCEVEEHEVNDESPM